jgi:RimJ/RimL family protein N-acetyltransferase
MKAIKTARLLLRPFEEADARRIAYLAGAYDVAKMCGRVPHPYTMASAYDFIDMTRAGQDSGAEHAFAVTAPIDGLVGSCGVMRVGGEESATYEIGYWFGMPYWGAGLCLRVGAGADGLGARRVGRESFRGRAFR